MPDRSPLGKPGGGSCRHLRADRVVQRDVGIRVLDWLEPRHRGQDSPIYTRTPRRAVPRPPGRVWAREPTPEDLRLPARFHRGPVAHLEREERGRSGIVGGSPPAPGWWEGGRGCRTHDRHRHEPARRSPPPARCTSPPRAGPSPVMSAYDDSGGDRCDFYFEGRPTARALRVRWQAQGWREC